LKIIPAFIPDLFWNPRNSTTISLVVYAKGRGGHGHQTPKIELLQVLHIIESLWQLLNDPSMADLAS